MPYREVRVITERHSIRVRFDHLLTNSIDAEQDRPCSLGEIFLLRAVSTGRLIILDVLSLFSSEVGCLPRLTRNPPSMLVVGFRDDADSLIAAWNEGIPAYPIEDLASDTVKTVKNQASHAFEKLGVSGRHELLARSSDLPSPFAPTGLAGGASKY